MREVLWGFRNREMVKFSSVVEYFSTFLLQLLYMVKYDFPKKPPDNQCLLTFLPLLRGLIQSAVFKSVEARQSAAQAPRFWKRLLGAWLSTGTLPTRVRCSPFLLLILRILRLCSSKLQERPVLSTELKYWGDQHRRFFSLAFLLELISYTQ